MKGRTYGDFVFSARVRSSENFAANAGGDHAVVFGLQDASNYYYAMFNRTAAETHLFKVVGGVRQPALASASYAIPDNEYHQIEVSRSGSLVTVKADDAVLMQANDATFGAGRVGIGALNDAAWWDDIAIALPAPTDTSAPSTPANVVATALSYSEIAVSWSASTDDVGVTGYRLYRDTTLVASPTGTSASVNGLSGGTLYAFSVAALDAAGNASTQSAPVLVTTPVPVPPTISFSAAPATIAAGQSVNLTWSSTSATSCTASDGWSGARPTSGSQAVAPSATTTYILTCTGIGGSASTSALVSVTTPVPTVSHFRVSGEHCCRRVVHDHMVVHQRRLLYRVGRMDGHEAELRLPGRQPLVDDELCPELHRGGGQRRPKRDGGGYRRCRDHGIARPKPGVGRRAAPRVLRCHGHDGRRNKPALP